MNNVDLGTNIQDKKIDEKFYISLGTWPGHSQYQ